MSIVLVIDVGTSGVRAAVVDGDGRVTASVHREVLPDSPAPGLVELDAVAIAEATRATADEVLSGLGAEVAAVGITNQRASTVVWDRATGEPVGPGIGWQDLRTVGRCLELQGQGLRFAPNSTATKAEALLDAADPDRSRDLCVGTVDTWVAWQLSGGSLHVTDASNAAVTGLFRPAADGWDRNALEVLRIPEASLPEVVDSTGVVGPASALPGAPPIAGIAGDQQASLIGQGGTRPGLAKITFGTGGMLDLCLDERPPFETRGRHGCFPIVAWRNAGRTTWGVEATMLSAGTCVEWLRDDLGVIDTAADSAAVAAACATTGDVWFVPALLGLGAPRWDFGARGALVGITRGTGRAEVVRAVLEGVAHRGADLVEAAEADTGITIGAIRVDGGMTENPVFLQALADATQRPVEVSPEREATTLGAGLLAGTAVGLWADVESLADLWSPAGVVEPAGPTDRDRWREAVERAAGWEEGLSAIEF